MLGHPTNLDYSRTRRACCASLKQVQDGWAVTLFLYVSSILSHLYSSYLILFCSSISFPLSLTIPFSFVHQSHVHYLCPFHSEYLIFFCLSLSCPLSLSISFKSSHFFCSSISCPLSLAHLFHADDLIQFCSSISCSLSLVHHSI